MHKLLVTTLITALLIAAFTARGDAQLLPEDFNFSLSEISPGASARSPIPSACTGDAAHSLPCREMLVILRNTGKRIIRISGSRCDPEPFGLEFAVPGTFRSGVSESKSLCSDRDAWTNKRLAPGEHIDVPVRFASAGRDPSSLPAWGQLKVTASVRLYGCIDGVAEDDCLSPQQTYPPMGSIAEIHTQRAVVLTSNSIMIEAKTVPIPSVPRLALTILPLSSKGPSLSRPDTDANSSSAHCLRTTRSAECVVFRFAIQNNGSIALRYGRFTCSDLLFMPEYRSIGGSWQKLTNGPWACTRNVYYEVGIRAGSSVDGEFTLRGLPGVWNTNPLRAAGIYQFRFTFYPHVCRASADASFCLTERANEPAVLSNTVTVHAEAAIGEPDREPF